MKKQINISDPVHKLMFERLMSCFRIDETIKAYKWDVFTFTEKSDNLYDFEKEYLLTIETYNHKQNWKVLRMKEYLIAFGFRIFDETIHTGDEILRYYLKVYSYNGKASIRGEV